MILKNNLPKHFDGCNSVVVLDEKRKGTTIKLLQITDMQFIDSSQQRTPDRIRQDEIDAWTRENFEAQSGAHIRSLIAQSCPDLIFITGDIIYGEFDDSGKTLDWFCSFMDSFKIPWAPVYGNHDNESKMGVRWQNQRFENSEYCLFKTGNVTGNGNYTVGVAIGDELVRVLYMADSNGCGNGTDELIEKMPGIFPDQLEYFNSCADKIEKAQGKKIPAIMGYHIPTDEFFDIPVIKGYAKTRWDFFTIGVDVEQKDGDFGFRLEKGHPGKCEGLLDFLKRNRVEGVFVGHEHSVSTCINYEGIKWVFGLKTGQYDYHVPGNTGGTLIRLVGEELEVCHLPSLVKHGPYPTGGAMFNDFFVKTTK